MDSAFGFTLEEAQQLILQQFREDIEHMSTLGIRTMIMTWSAPNCKGSHPVLLHELRAELERRGRASREAGCAPTPRPYAETY